MANLTPTFLFTDIEGSAAVTAAGLAGMRVHRAGRPEQIFQVRAEAPPAAFRCGRRATRRC